ncbi:MAG: thioredoxin family protein [Pirellulaceae bacterium]
MFNKRSILATAILAMIATTGCDRYMSMRDTGSDDPVYSSQQFDEIIHAAPLVMVKFGAPWCGPCRRIDEELPNVTGSVKVVSINVDRNPELSSQFRIQGIPTMILFRDGEKVASQSGYSSAEELSSWVAKYEANAS